MLELVLGLALQEAVVTIRGTLLNGEGRPAPGLAVRLEMGRQAFDLGMEYPEYRAAAHRATLTAEDGSFVFEKVPADANVHLISLGLPKDDDHPACEPGVAVLRGPAAKLSREAPVLRLKSGRQVRGRIVPPDPKLRLFMVCGDGWQYAYSTQERDGTFVIDGASPGEAWLVFKGGGRAYPPRRLTLPEGEDVELGPIEPPRPRVPTSLHPEVQAERARVVDVDGRPLPGVTLGFRTPSAGAQGTTDEKGELRLKGDSLYIGEPPYQLHLDDLERAADGRRFQGRASERGDTVVITLTPLTRVEIAPRRAGAPVEDVVIAAHPPEPAEVVLLEKEGGRFKGWLPPGRVRLRVGTIQGTVVEREIDVPAADVHPAALDLEP